MPQFDPFIFESILVFFITCYFCYLYFNINLFLPRLAFVLKFRHKLLRDMISIYHKREARRAYLRKLQSEINSWK